MEVTRLSSGQITEQIKNIPGQIKNIPGQIDRYNGQIDRYNRQINDILPIDNIITLILFFIIAFFIPYILDKKKYNLILLLTIISITIFILEKINMLDLYIFNTPELNDIDFRKLILIHLFLIIFSIYFNSKTSFNNLINLFPKKNIKEQTPTIFILYFITNIYKIFLVALLIIRLFSLENNIDTTTPTTTTTTTAANTSSSNNNLFLIIQFFVLLIISLFTAIILYSSNNQIKTLKFFIGVIFVTNIFLLFLKPIWDNITDPDRRKNINNYIYLNRNIKQPADKNPYNAFNNLQNYIILLFIFLSIILAIIEFIKNIV
jgi:hypothetical protein